jgi:queuine tRNA-ribosyltransferase
MSFKFEIVKSDASGIARIGRITTPNGVIDTPAFIFCATKAALKSLTTDQLVQENTQIILANTYHLFIQPGEETVNKLGGLHKMMNWKGPMLTDSGGWGMEESLRRLKERECFQRIAKQQC